MREYIFRVAFLKEVKFFCIVAKSTIKAREKFYAFMKPFGAEVWRLLGMYIKSCASTEPPVVKGTGKRGRPCKGRATE